MQDVNNLAINAFNDEKKNDATNVNMDKSRIQQQIINQI